MDASSSLRLLKKYITTTWYNVGPDAIAIVAICVRHGKEGWSGGTAPSIPRFYHFECSDIKPIFRAGAYISFYTSKYRIAARNLAIGTSS